jgi:hypothetical protein
MFRLQLDDLDNVTEDANLNISSIRNIQGPENTSDVATERYVDSKKC